MALAAPGIPAASLIAVNYSILSSGLNWPEFDGFRAFAAWANLDDRKHAQAVLELTRGGALWLSASDREVRWIASALARLPAC